MRRRYSVATALAIGCASLMVVALWLQQSDFAGRAQHSPVPLILLLLAASGLIALLFAEERRRFRLEVEIEQLGQIERQLRGDIVALLEAVPLPLLIMSRSGEVAYANRASVALARAPRGQAEVRALGLAVSRQFEPQLDAGGRQRRRFDLARGDRPPLGVAVTAQSLRLFERDAMLYLVIDETPLREAETRAMAASRLALLGELSAAIVHELNQPLAAIHAAATNGHQLDPLEQPSRVTEKFSRIGRQAQRARHIIDDVRQLGRADKQVLRPFSITHAVDAAVALIRPECTSRGVVLDVDAHLSASVIVNGARTLFEIAVLNVLLNALQAYGDCEGAGDTRTIRVAMRFIGQSAVVEIHDNAGGIPKDILDRVFEPFVSSKPPEHGTGVGLAVTRRAIVSMGGAVEAANHAGGALITIRLPTVAQEIAA